MTKRESKIIRSILTSGSVVTLNIKEFVLANEVLTEIMRGGFTIEDMSEHYGVDYCWVFIRSKF
jgi:hypothetical protein